MKASVTNGTGMGFVLEDIDIDEPIGAEVLIQVKASGLCRSDLSIQEHAFGGLYPLPALLGHEPAGEVIATGPDVTDFQVGDHVVGSLIQSCGSCVHCLTERSYICQNPAATTRREGQRPRLSRGGEPLFQGFALGGFAQQMLVHQNQLVKLPKDMPWAQAALLGCGVITGAGAVLNRANVRQGESVVVVGTGGVGLNGVSGAVVAGANPIIAVDVEDSKLEVAKSFGATHVINSRNTNAVDAVKEITGGGAQHVFDYVGHSAVLQDSLAMVGSGGGLYLIGASPDGAVTLPVVEAENFSKSISGVNMGASTIKRDIPMYSRLYMDGRFKLDELVSVQIPLSEVQQGYELLKDSSVIRVVITDFEN
ncbi:zinc-binding dehydrogenase [Diaminobutyricimonas sp. TR449]|uniref:zinc-binding dehydrogenase n=1 Tax=Diaminobutyricimonas sp. TR449 TaxID=2708076 RepID=UPI0014207A1E|nr:zinc-binding dehydrogenase [Diaminobutyricimonas sp. TR449]